MAETYLGSLCKWGHDDGTGHSVRYSSGTHACVECAKQWSRDREDIPRTYRGMIHHTVKEYTKAGNLWNQYHIEYWEWLLMFQEQGGRCLWCDAQFNSPYDMCVDHDHNTEENLGLSCEHCNLARREMVMAKSHKRMAVAELFKDGEKRSSILQWKEAGIW